MSQKKIKRPKGSPIAPHPFVLEPMDMEKTLYMAGDEFKFRLILIGDVIKWIPYLVYATINMGEMGIGKGRKDGLGRFRLKYVKQDQQIIYTDQSKELYPKDSGRYIQLENPQQKINKLQVDFLTPYRAKFKNSLVTSFDFGVLIRAALRRIANLEDYFAGKEPDLDYRGLVHRSNGVKMILEEKKWVDMPRFSFRQRAKMKLGGLVGRAVYEGELFEFFPILKYCETVHVGKQTSFGFGKIRLSIL